MEKESIFNIEVKNHFIYNSYSGALVRLENSLKKYMDDGNTRELQKQGFIVDSQINEMNRFILQRYNKIYSRTHIGLKYVIAITNECQAHCTYCFEKGIVRNEIMDKETAHEIIKYIKAQLLNTNAPKLEITFFGGEPLLNYDIIVFIGHELATFCSENRILYFYNIITNGIALTKDKAKVLAELGVQFAQITLDGTREEYRKVKKIDSFDQVIKNIKECISILPVDVRLNVTRDNRSDISLLIDYLMKECSLRDKIQITLAQVVDYVGTEFDYRLCLNGVEFAEFVREIFLTKRETCGSSLKSIQLLPKVLRTFCGMENCNQFVIGPRGELYKCEHNVGKKSEIVGDIFTGLYYSDKEMMFYLPIDKKCTSSQCPFLPLCVGGCVNERNQRGIVNCQIIKERTLKLLNAYIDIL